MAKRHPIDLQLTGIAAADGTVTIRSGQFKPGGLLCLQHVSCRDTVDADVTYHVSLERSGQQLYLETLISTVAGQVVALKNKVYAPSDYGVTIEVSGATAADTISIGVFGYWTDFPE